jgi:hypothetical protein
MPRRRDFPRYIPRDNADMKNRSHVVIADVVVPDSGAEGVIVAQGGITGGWCLYANDGKLEYCYNFLGLERTYIDGTRRIPSGTHEVRMEFAYDGGGLGKGATVTLYVDGEQSGQGRVERTEPIAFSTDNTFSLDEDGSRASTDYLSRTNRFSGMVISVEIHVEDASPGGALDAARVDSLVAMTRP